MKCLQIYEMHHRSFLLNPLSKCESAAHKQSGLISASVEIGLESICWRK